MHACARMRLRRPCCPSIVVASVQTRNRVAASPARRCVPRLMASLLCTAMSTEGASGQRREGDENFDELLEALAFQRNNLMTEEEGKSANPVEAWKEVTASWMNDTATCVLQDWRGRVIPLHRTIPSLFWPSEPVQDISIEVI